MNFRCEQCRHKVECVLCNSVFVHDSGGMIPRCSECRLKMQEDEVMMLELLYKHQEKFKRRVLMTPGTFAKIVYSFGNE